MVRSSRREVLIRILALLQSRTLIETKNSTLKCLNLPYSTVRSMKNVAVLTENVEFALFFFPTPGDLTAEESLPPGICHSRQKNGNARAGGQPKGGGWAPVELTVLMVCGSTPAEGTIFLFFFLVVLLLFS